MCLCMCVCVCACVYIYYLIYDEMYSQVNYISNLSYGQWTLFTIAIIYI